MRAMSEMDLSEAFKEEDVIVGVTLVREDLRQLLVVASIHQLEEQDRGNPRNERLALARKRIGATATSTEWQPKKPGS
jgi:hypothetical protein